MNSEWIKLAKQTLTYTAGASSGKLIALLTVPLYLHYLTPSEYGFIGIAIATTTGARILGVIGGSGALGIRYFAASGPSAQQEVLRSAVLLNTVSALVSLLVVLGILAWTLGSVAPLNLPTSVFLVLIALSVAISIASEPLMLALQLQQRANHVVAINVGASVTGGLLGCGLLISGVGVTSWAAAQSTSSLLTFYFSKTHIKPALSTARGCTAECRALLKTWYPLVPGAALSAAVPVITPYLLWQIGGAKAAGLFAVASQFAAVVALLTGALATAWLPYFQSHVNQQIKWTHTYRQLLHIHLIGGTLICVAIWVVADDVLRWLSASAYAGAGKAIYPLVVANVLGSLWSFLLPGTYFAGHTAMVSWTHFVGALTAGIVLASYGTGLDAAAAAKALALGSAAVVLIQLLINSTRQYQVHRFSHAWVVVTTLAMCASLFVR